MHQMGGEIPKIDSRLLPANMAKLAINTDLTSGAPTGLPVLSLVEDLSAVSGDVKRAYRLPGPNPGDPDVWIPLPSPYSKVVRSPLANDTLHRVYWTSPGEGAKWNTYARIAAASPAYDLGFIPPSSVVLTCTPSGGTTDGTIPLVERSYLLTFVDDFGAESSPSNPTAVVAGAPDGTWAIGGIPTTPPTGVVGKDYPPVQGMKLYRTVTGQSTGAQFYLVTTWDFTTNPPPGTGIYDDVSLDINVAQNLPLITASWASPPDDLDGITAMPGGMLVGFTGDTIHFCEPNYPHTWPAGYDSSVHYPVVDLAVWQQSLLVLTQGFPSAGSGNAPSNFVFNQIQVPEPCIARGSIITDLLGVYYASQNGLMMLTYFGVSNQTEKLMDKNIWLNEYLAPSLISCRHRQQYLAINGSGGGFLIDYTDQRLGVVHLSTFLGADCIWNDEYTGDAYIISGKKVYLWDDPAGDPMVWRWRSKDFYLPQPANFGAAQVSADNTIADALPPLSMPLDTGDPLLVLPPGVNAVFNAYLHNKLVHTENLSEPRSIFRLPSGFKGFDWSFEVISRVKIFSIEVAPTPQELSTV